MTSGDNRPRQHPEVLHPTRMRLREDLLRYERGWRGRLAAGNDWLATHLAVIFGVAWTIWVFFTVPLVAYFLPADVQNHIFFFSSGWVQLFALPLMVYVSNKIQKTSDLQSDATYKALTHVALEMDELLDIARRIQADEKHPEDSGGHSA